MARVQALLPKGVVLQSLEEESTVVAGGSVTDFSLGYSNNGSTRYVTGTYADDPDSRGKRRDGSKVLAKNNVWWICNHESCVGYQFQAIPLSRSVIVGNRGKKCTNCQRESRTEMKNVTFRCILKSCEGYQFQAKPVVDDRKRTCTKCGADNAYMVKENSSGTSSCLASSHVCGCYFTVCFCVFSPACVLCAQFFNLLTCLLYIFLFCST